MAPPREVLEAEERADAELAALLDEARAEAERRHDAVALLLFAILMYEGSRRLSHTDIPALRRIVAEYGDKLRDSFDDLIASMRRRARDLARRDVAASYRAIFGRGIDFGDVDVELNDLADAIRSQTVSTMEGYAVSAAIQRARWGDLAEQLAGKEGSVTSTRRGRVANAVDSDAALIYAGTSQACMERIADDGILKQDVEVIDRRNHPISRVLNGQVVPIREPFRAPVGEVRSAASAMNRPMGGIFWPEVAGAFEGLTLPAHFGERGRVRLTSARWL